MSESTIADDLKAARALLEKGWCKNALERDGSYCVLGAVKMAVLGDVYAEVTSRQATTSGVLRGLIPAEYGRSLAAFNNADETTQQDVLNLFDKALGELGALA